MQTCGICVIFVHFLCFHALTNTIILLNIELNAKFQMILSLPKLYIYYI